MKKSGGKIENNVLNQQNNRKRIDNKPKKIQGVCCIIKIYSN